MSENISNERRLTLHIVKTLHDMIDELIEQMDREYAERNKVIMQLREENAKMREKLASIIEGQIAK